MSPCFVLGRENVPCVAEVVNRSLKADCTDFTTNLRNFENCSVLEDVSENIHALISLKSPAVFRKFCENLAGIFHHIVA